jgi:hypothetical protein
MGDLLLPADFWQKYVDVSRVSRDVVSGSLTESFVKFTAKRLFGLLPSIPGHGRTVTTSGASTWVLSKVLSTLQSTIIYEAQVFHRLCSDYHLYIIGLAMVVCVYCPYRLLMKRIDAIVKQQQAEFWAVCKDKEKDVQEFRCTAKFHPSAST